MFPRGGGVWDQDPILMQDFRVIQRFEREWKEVEMRSESNSSGGSGGNMGMKEAMESYLEELGEDGRF